MARKKGLKKPKKLSAARTLAGLKGQSE